MDMIEERRIKQDRVREYLDSHKLDAVLLSRRCNFSWFTCGAHNFVNNACDVGNSWLLVDKDSAVVLTSNIEAPRLQQEELASSGIEVIDFPYYHPEARAGAFEKLLAGRAVAADAPPPAVKLPALGSDFDRLRWTLTESEVERYAALCTDVAGAVEFIARDVDPGRTEYETAGMLSGAIRCCGATPWVLLVAGDERVSQFRHPLPTDLVIQDYFMLVICAERNGLIAACSRLASFGRLSEELAAKHRAVAMVDAAFIGATNPGAKFGDIYAEGQEAYAAAGFADQWQFHHQGGSCGYLPREVVAGPGDATVAMANQAFAWNPSIAGTKSEDTILCTPDGPQLLAAPGDWPILKAEWKGAAIPRPDILVR